MPAATPTSGDLEFAHLWYADADGTTTNTAEYGADRWLVNTNWYDNHGNIARSLDGAGRARALAAAPVDRQSVAYDASAFTVYNDDGDEDRTDGDGTRVEDEFGPAHTATLKDDTSGRFRAHIGYIYDDENANLGGGDKPALPSGQTSFNLVVETRYSATGTDMLSEYDSTLTRNEYGAVVIGDGNGWTLGTPTQVKTQRGWVLVHPGHSLRHPGSADRDPATRRRHRFGWFGQRRPRHHHELLRDQCSRQ